MEELTFVRTRHTYDSYVDFWRLVELSGFPTCYVDEIDLHSAGTYIVAPMNGEWKQFLDGKPYEQRKAKLLLWNLERPGGSGTLADYITSNSNLIEEHFLDGVIVSDKDLAARSGFHFIPLGSHKGLNEYPTVNPEVKEFDLIFLACYSNRRSQLFQYPGVLKSELYGMSIAPNSWNGQRAHNLRHSKFMVGTHQDSFSFCEPLRFALAVAYRLPIISEYCVDPFPYYTVGNKKSLDTLLVYAKDQVAEYHIEYEYWNTVAEINYVCATTDFSFRRCIERYL